MSRDFRVYLVPLVLLGLGMHLHVVLFNLYLADLGFREDVMGRLVGAMTLGTAAGTIPAAALSRGLGLRAAIMISVCGLTLSLALRAMVMGTALTVTSFLAGFFLAGWFVTNPPAIAALAGQSAFAFSLNNSLAIGVGAGAGLLAGFLPGWLPGGSPAASKRMALLVAAGLVGLAAVVVPRIRFPDDAKASAGGGAAGILNRFRRSPPGPGRRRDPQPVRFLLRFLLAMTVWYAFSDGLVPFFNVYLRNRLGAPLETIGGIFAASQLAQGLAVLLMAPLIVRLGLVRAVVMTQLLAAGALFALWPVRTMGVAASFYLLSMSFYVMSEPGLQNLLMSRIPAEDRAAASAANILLLFAMQAVVATAAGALIVARGYEALFIALGVTGVAAAALFAALFSPAFLAESAPAPSVGGSSPEPRG